MMSPNVVWYTNKVKNVLITYIKYRKIPKTIISIKYLLYEVHSNIFNYIIVLFFLRAIIMLIIGYYQNKSLNHVDEELMN